MMELLISLTISLFYIGALFVWYKLRFKDKSLMSFAKNALLPVVLIGGFALYLIGYWVAGSYSFNVAVIWLSLYSTARLLILGNDLVEIKEIFHATTEGHGQVMDESHQMLMELLHLGISLILATVVFVFILIFIRVIATTLKNRRLIKKSKAKENYLFFSGTSASISLAKDILSNPNRKKDSLVMFVDRFLNEDEKQGVRQLVNNGVILVGEESLLDRFELKNEELMISLGLHSHDEEKNSMEFQGDFFTRHRLRECILKRKTHLFFFSDDEEYNIRQAKRIMTELKSLHHEHQGDYVFSLYIRTLAQDCLEDEYDKLVRGDGMELRYINDALLAARRLVKDHPPVKYVDPDTEKALARADFTPLLLGFGKVGQSVLRKLVEMGSFLGNSFKAVALDENMDHLVGRFENRFPGMSKNYDLTFRHESVGDKSFYESLRENPEFFRYVVVSLGNDELNLLIALELKHMAKRLNVPYSIFIHINDVVRYDQLFNDSLDMKDPNLVIFGRMDCLYNFADIVDNTILKQARRMHTMYMLHSDLSRRVNKDWNSLERMKKLSNISALEHLQTKCLLAGFTEAQIIQMDSEADFVKALGQKRLENLAIGEHLRWNAHYFSNGWDTLPLEEIVEKNSANSDRRLHSCLVSWEELDEVEKRLYDVKKYDRINVIEMWEQLRIKREDIQMENDSESDQSLTNMR